MNKQKTLVDNFSGLSEDEKSLKKTASLFLVKLVLTKVNHWQMSKMLKKTRGEEERGADGLTAEILEARFEQRSPVNEW